MLELQEENEDLANEISIYEVVAKICNEKNLKASVIEDTD